MATQIFDVTLTLQSDMLLYPGTPPYELTEYRKISDGDSSNNSKISLCVHTGTHLDAPRHFVEGQRSIDEIPPTVLVGPCRIFDLRVEEKITASDLSPLPWEDVCRVLFRTRNSELLQRRDFDPGFVYLDESAARFLLEKKIILVGLDYLSIDQYHGGSHPAHHLLLGAGVVALEGVDLLHIQPGDYDLLCCPLKSKGQKLRQRGFFFARSKVDL